MLSLIILFDLGLKDSAGSLIELSHPLNPMQPYNMHQAFHHVQSQHHPNSNHEECYAPDIGDIRMIF